MRARRWLTTFSALALMGSLSLVHSVPGAYAAAPTNDSFAGGISISGSSGSTTGSNLDATVETDEPTPFGNVGAVATVWWNWTAPSNGTYMFDTCGSNFTTSLGVFTGSAVDSLAEASPSSASSCAYGGNYLYQQERVFTATAGTVYHIQVGSGKSDGSVGAMGDITLRWRLSAIPSNDNFASATLLTGSSGTTTGTDRFATAETGDPLWFEGLGTVWWKWTPPSDGTYMFDTCGSNYDTKMGVYSGTSLATLTQVYQNDDSCTYQSAATFSASTLDTYYIAVGGYDQYSIGDITLRWQPEVSPVNDNFADATPISGASGSVSGNTRFATNENESTWFGDHTIWWLWTAPSAGTVVFDTCGSDAYTRLGAFTGTDVSSLTEVSEAADASCLANQSMLTFEATAGAQYAILVGDGGSGPGDIALNWQMGTPPTNDNFSSATVLSGTGGTATGNNMFATAESGEPGMFTGHSVWYTWTAPDTVPVTFDTCGSTTHYASLGVYTGDAPDALTAVAEGHAGYEGTWVNDACDDQVSLSFTPVQGTMYHIAVGFDTDTMGPFVLHWPSSISTVSAPVVTTQPSPQTVSAGESVQFDAAATGTPTPTVRWQESTDNGANWSDIPDATESTLILTAEYPMSGYQYRAVFTNAGGSTPSNAATLTVNAVAPVITTQPQSQSLVVDSTANFSAAASGNPSPTVQWQSLPPGGGTWGDIAGATNPVYSVTNVTTAISGTQFRAVFTNPGGDATTDVATLTVFNLPPAPNTPDASSTTSKGKMAVTLTWTDNGDGGSAITDHVVSVYSYKAATKNHAAIYSFVSNVYTQSTSAGATFTIKAGNYAFTVAAVNAGGAGAESPYSNVVNR